MPLTTAVNRKNVILAEVVKIGGAFGAVLATDNNRILKIRHASYMVVHKSIDESIWVHLAHPYIV